MKNATTGRLNEARFSKKDCCCLSEQESLAVMKKVDEDKKDRESKEKAQSRSPKRYV